MLNFLKTNEKDLGDRGLLLQEKVRSDYEFYKEAKVGNSGISFGNKHCFICHIILTL